MDNRSNTIAGWVLGSAMVALALSIAGNIIFEPAKPEKMGYPIAGVVEDAGTAKVAEVPIATLLASADAAHGAEVFKKCAACHNAQQGGANGIGPNLWATVGEAIAEGKGGYAFSDALKTAGAGKKWDFEQLNLWLTNPRGYASGTKMTFAGIENGKDRADVILYLNTQGSNLPLPAAPAAPTAAPATPGAAPAAAPGIAAAPTAGETPVASPVTGSAVQGTAAGTLRPDKK